MKVDQYVIDINEQADYLNKSSEEDPEKRGVRPFMCMRLTIAIMCMIDVQTIARHHSQILASFRYSPILLLPIIPSLLVIFRKSDIGFAFVG